MSSEKELAAQSRDLAARCEAIGMPALSAYYLQLANDLEEGTDARHLPAVGGTNTSPTPPPTPGPLVRLETGDWVDPSEVIGLEVDDAIESPWVDIHFKNGSTLRNWASSVTAITGLADRIAAQINAARRGGGEDGR